MVHSAIGVMVVSCLSCWSCPQAGGEIVVGNAQQLAECSKGSQGAGTEGAKPSPADVSGAGTERTGVSEAEGLFSGMERVSVPRGSVMAWNSNDAQGGISCERGLRHDDTHVNDRAKPAALVFAVVWKTRAYPKCTACLCPVSRRTSLQEEGLCNAGRLQLQEKQVNCNTVEGRRCSNTRWNRI